MLATVKKLQTALEQSICETYFMDNFEDDTAVGYLVERISEEMEKHITLIRYSAHTLKLAIIDVFAKHDLNLKAVTNIETNQVQAIHWNE